MDYRTKYIFLCSVLVVNVANTTSEQRTSFSFADDHGTTKVFLFCFHMQIFVDKGLRDQNINVTQLWPGIL